MRPGCLCVLLHEYGPLLGPDTSCLGLRFHPERLRFEVKWGLRQEIPGYEEFERTARPCFSCISAWEDREIP